MLSLKTNCFLKPKILIGYIDDYYHCIKQAKPCLYAAKTHNFLNCTSNNKARLHVASCYGRNKFIKRDNSNVHANASTAHVSNYNRKFCAKALPKDPNVFGDLSYERYERVKMDEDEEMEEKLADKGGVQKWEKFTYKEYCKLIKMHLQKKDLQLALNVLDVMKENGDKPTLYIYRLLLSAFSKQGDMKQCFKLFKQIKDRGLTPSPSVYNTLINACAEADDTERALGRLKILRDYFHEKQIHLNEIHYTSLIKAYSWHNDISTAFEIADEAKDNGICTADLISVLFHAAISDKENGLKHALRLWHKMKIIRIKPNLNHYNLLLKAIGDTKLGNLKVHDMLIPDSAETQIQLSETGRPDLMESPPTLSTSLITLLGEPNDMPNDSKTELSMSDNSTLLSQNLNNILEGNRLLLFGGIDKFLNRMKSDNVQPDKKTITLLLQLLPSTLEAEKYFLKYIRENDIEVDITFFNVLIKRRSLRKQYNLAKDVLNEIQSYYLMPNIITFGVLSLGCTRHKDGIELLEQMDTIGYAPNYVVLETLLYNACIYRDFSYILHLMHFILEKRVKFPKHMLNILDKFEQVILQLLESEGKHHYKKINEVRKGYNKFKIRYENLKEKLQREDC